MKKLFFVLFAALSLTNCKKSEDTEMSTPIRPKTVISEYKNDYNVSEIDTSTIFYNGNRIDFIVSSRGKTTYEYSDHSAIIKEFRGKDAIAWHYQKYLYDEKGRVAKIEFYLNVNSDYQVWKGPKVDSFNREKFYYNYEYLTDGSVKEQFLYDYSDKSTTDYDIIKYDNYGNIVTITSYYYIQNQYLATRIESMEYDNKSHYMKNVDIPIFPSSSKINNITRINTTHINTVWDPKNGSPITSTTLSVINYTYQYDNNGFPTTMLVEGDPDYKSMVFKY